MTVNELVARLFELYPKELAADYDNAGLLVGDGNDEIRKTVVALDCTPAAIEYAASIGANLIVTHHPVIFHGEKSVTSGDRVYELIKNGISCIAMHTNFDTAEGGVCDILCKRIGMESVTPFMTGEGIAIRVGEFPNSLSAHELASRLKAELSCTVRYSDAAKSIKRVAVCAGSGSDFIRDVMGAKVDGYISGELEHYDFLDPIPMGISVFDCGHFETERISVEVLKGAVEEITGGATVEYKNSEIKVI